MENFQSYHMFDVYAFNKNYYPHSSLYSPAPTILNADAYIQTLLQDLEKEK